MAPPDRLTLPGAIQPFPSRQGPIWYGQETEDSATLAAFIEQGGTDYLYQDRGTGGTPLELTAERWETLTYINASVNDRTTYANDPTDSEGNDLDTHLLPENNNWRGDCEDFALQKQKELIEAGFPPESVLLAYGDADNAILGDPRNHAVLIVRTDHGDFVLNNDEEVSEVTHWQDSAMRITSMQSPEDPSIMIRTNFSAGHVSQSPEGGVSQIHMTQDEGNHSFYTNGEMPAGDSLSIGGAECTTERPLFYKASANVTWPYDTRDTEMMLRGTDENGQPVAVDLYTTRSGIDGPHALTDDAFSPLGSATGSEESIFSITPAEGQTVESVMAHYGDLAERMRQLGINCDQPLTASVSSDGKTVVAPLNITSIAVGVATYSIDMANDPSSTVQSSLVSGIERIPELPDTLPSPVTPAQPATSGNEVIR